MRGDEFTFLTPQAGWILLAAMLVAGLLIWRAWRREATQLRIARILALALACLSLALIGTQPARWQTGADQVAIVFTSAVEKNLSDSLQTALPAARYFDLYQSWQDSVPVFSELKALQQSFPACKEWHLVGDGPAPWDLPDLSDNTFFFHANPLPAGLIDWDHSTYSRVGNSLSFSGQVNNPAGQITHLTLASPAGRLPLLEDLKPGIQSFSLRIPAREAGRFLFQVVAAQKDSAQNQYYPVPVVIEEKLPIRVLILNHAPDFETRYLKNWLSNEGYSVAMRATVSRDKYLTEWNNLPEQSLDRITPGLLAEFDLVVLPFDALENLPAPEWRVLQAEIGKGLGVFLLPDDIMAWPPSGTRAQSLTAPFEWQPGENFILWPAFSSQYRLPTRPYRFRNQPAGLSLFPLPLAGLGSAYRIKQGKVGLSLLTQTYQLLLEGQNQAYETIWTTALEKLARPQRRSTDWMIPQSPLIFPDHPLEVWFNAGEMPATLQVLPDSSAWPLRQDPIHHEKFLATLWPARPGWQQLSAGQADETHWIFIQTPPAWSSLRSARRMQKTREWPAGFTKEGSLSEAPVRKVPKALPLWWFFLMFLFSAGFLWLEEKL